MSKNQKTATERTSLLTSQPPRYERESPSISVQPKPKNSPSELYGYQLLKALFFTWIAAFFGGLDSTITSTLSTTIASDLDDLTIISWLASGYLIGTAVVYPLSGKLSDVFGRRESLVFSSVVFAVGNAICGLADSKMVLILGRVSSGIGAGGLYAVGAYTATDLIPIRERGLWQGYSLVVKEAGIGLGGVIGGAINETWGWRWAFLVLTPLSLLCAVGMWYCVPDIEKIGAKQGSSKLSYIRRIDFLGSTILVLAVILLFSAFNYVTDLNPSTIRILEISLPIVAVLLALFVLVEKKYAAEPIIELDLLCDRTVAGVCLAFGFLNMVMYALLFYIPIYLGLRGFKTSDVGLLMLPWSLGSSTGALGAGVVLRAMGYVGGLKYVLFCVLLGTCAGFVGLSPSTPLVIPELYITLTGFSIGALTTTLTINLLCAIKHEKQAVTSAICYTFRSVGSMFGVSLPGLIFRQLLSSQLQDEGGVVIEPPRGGHFVGDNRGHEVRDAYMYALRATYMFVFCSAVAGLVCIMFTKNFNLSSTITRKESNKKTTTTTTTASEEGHHPTKNSEED